VKPKPTCAKYYERNHNNSWQHRGGGRRWSALESGGRCSARAPIKKLEDETEKQPGKFLISARSHGAAAVAFFTTRTHRIRHQFAYRTGIANLVAAAFKDAGFGKRETPPDRHAVRGKLRRSSGRRARETRTHGWAYMGTSIFRRRRLKEIFHWSGDGKINRAAFWIERNSDRRSDH